MNDYVTQLKMHLTLSGIHVHEDMPAPLQLLESGEVVMARVYRFESELELELHVKRLSDTGKNFKYYQHIKGPTGSLQLRCAVW